MIAYFYNLFRVTGFISMKIGKVAAVGLGGSVILLHIASQKGYIDINWDKINKRVDKITDKIEKEATGKSPNWTEKVSTYLIQSWFSIYIKILYIDYKSKQSYTFLLIHS